MALSKIDVANMLTGTIPVDNAKSGSILQVQSTLVTSPFQQSISAQTDTAITNMSVNITPSATSNKIMIMARLVGELSTSNNYDIMYFILRGSTKINSGDADGVRNTGIIPQSHGFYDANASSTMDSGNMFTIDSSHNSTSQLTYHIGIGANTAATFNVNRTVSTSNSYNVERGSSEIIAMEIKG